VTLSEPLGEGADRRGVDRHRRCGGKRSRPGPRRLATTWSPRIKTRASAAPAASAPGKAYTRHWQTSRVARAKDWLCRPSTWPTIPSIRPASSSARSLVLSRSEPPRRGLVAAAHRRHARRKGIAPKRRGHWRPQTVALVLARAWPWPNSGPGCYYGSWESGTISGIGEAIVEMILDSLGLSDWRSDRRRRPGKPHTFVPDVTNRSVDDARQALVRCGLRMRLRPHVRQLSLTERIVVAQEPTRGTKVREGTRVKVQVSPGIEPHAIRHKRRNPRPTSD
jgi:hypothetical protein